MLFSNRQHRQHHGFATMIGLSALCVSSQSYAAPVTVRDMVEIRTIDSLSISPDRRYVAYRLVQPSLSANRVEARWFRIPLTGGDPERLGGAPAPIFMPLFDEVEEGVSQWAPDSSALYVLGTEHSETQIFRMRPGGQQEQVSHDAADVVDFQLDNDGIGLVYHTRDSRVAISAAQAANKARGLLLTPDVITDGFPLFDNFAIGDRRTTIRYTPQGLVHEAFDGPLHLRHLRFSDNVVDDRPLSAPTPDTAQSLIIPPAGDSSATVSSRRAPIRLDPTSPSAEFPEYRIVARLEGRDIPCPETFCSGSRATIRQADWLPQTGEVIVRYASETDRTVALYSWSPMSGRKRQIFNSNGVLTGGDALRDGICPIARTMMVCTLSRPSEPPRLVTIDLTTGKLSDLVTPNRQLAARSFGQVRSLVWIDAAGRQSSGTLVLPQAGGTHLPLVIMLSACTGFSQGGAVPLAPEHVLAAQGIAALCLNTFINNIPDHDADGRPIPLALHKAETIAMSAIIDRLATEGVIDRHRVGIVGHSFGAMVAAYALSHTDLFRAGVIGTGVTTDPSGYFITAPTPESSRRVIFPQMNLPSPEQDPQGIWKAESAALNADKIHAPLLLLPPQNEYLFGFQLYTSIRDAGGIARMIIYPDEGHLASREPSHLFSRQTNAVDWFACWLNRDGEVDMKDRSDVAINEDFRCPAPSVPREPHYEPAEAVGNPMSTTP